ncbi:hypothetical protein LLB_0301 [Legionella longbeachae D-4968]|nr:hypothetical protein LLB_0301 [Legionella longbeachae D-4968]
MRQGRNSNLIVSIILISHLNQLRQFEFDYKSIRDFKNTITHVLNHKA